MSKYQELDQALIATIAGGGEPLYARQVLEVAIPLATKSGRAHFRVIDGRLQALRKEGRLQWSTKEYAYIHGIKPGWRVVPSRDEETV